MMILNKRMWVVAICGVLLVVLHVTGRLTQTLGFVIVLAIFLGLLGGSWENELRYGTGQLISPTVRGSVDLDTMLMADEWGILPIGTYKSETWNFYKKGGQGTIVFKKSGTEDKILYRIGGGNALMLAEPKQVTELDLPGKVRDMIVDRKGFDPPFYLADKPLNPAPINWNPKWDVEAVRAENEALRRERNIYKDAYHGKTGMIDKELGRITGAARSMEFSRWKRWFGRQEEQRPKG